jgi:hypothetical protein
MLPGRPGINGSAGHFFSLRPDAVVSGGSEKKRLPKNKPPLQ